jgi:hypothetical protein
VQRRVAVEGALVLVRPAAQQQLHALHAARGGRLVQRRQAVVVRRVHVRARLDQHRGDVGSVRGEGHREVEGRLPSGGSGV